MAREPTNSEEHDHETCFCSCIGAGLCGRIDGRLCPLRRSWRGPWLCARRRHGPRIRSRFWQPGTADARFRKPDSGPARGTTAAPRDQRADVAAVAPGHVAARAGWVVVGPASAFCDTAHEPSPGSRAAGYCANSRRRDRLSVRFAFLVLESGLQGCSICDPDPALSHGSGKVFGGSVH